MQNVSATGSDAYDRSSLSMPGGGVLKAASQTTVKSLHELRAALTQLIEHIHATQTETTSQEDRNAGGAHRARGSIRCNATCVPSSSILNGSREI